MRQRNPGPYTLSVPSIPADVEPGDVVDFPGLIAGFEPVDDPGEPVPGPPSTVVTVDLPDEATPAADPEDPPPALRGGRKPPKNQPAPADAAPEEA